MTSLVDATGLPENDDIPEARFTRLRRYNLGMGVLHLVQAVAVLVLATAFALPVTAAFMTGPPGSTCSCRTRVPTGSSCRRRSSPVCAVPSWSGGRSTAGPSG